jgi:hypothetical protein
MVSKEETAKTKPSVKTEEAKIGEDWKMKLKAPVADTRLKTTVKDY